MFLVPQPHMKVWNKDIVMHESKCVYTVYINACYYSFLVCVHQNVNVPLRLAFRQKGLWLRKKDTNIRHKCWDCSEKSKCVWGRDYVCGFERVCMSVRKRLCLCVRDCLAQWVVWLCIYVCVCVAETLAGKTGQAFCTSVCISVWYQTFVHKMGMCSVFIPLLLVIIEAEQLTLPTALRTDTVHVSESFIRPETDFQTLWKSCLVPHESFRYHL